jgi:hypothetical protein
MRPTSIFDFFRLLKWKEKINTLNPVFSKKKDYIFGNSLRSKLPYWHHHIEQSDVMDSAAYD